MKRPADRQIELSNSLAENAIQQMAIGRRNWLHVASERAGLGVATILSVIETCRRYQIPICQYLSGVLPGLAEFPANRVSELIPGSWALGCTGAFSSITIKSEAPDCRGPELTAALHPLIKNLDALNRNGVGLTHT